MTEPDINTYIQAMEEIKRRTMVISSFLSNESTTIYKATNIESMYLQIRMILELIALASLAANKTIFEENQRKFHKHWSASDILKDIEKLNPGYYPEPIQEKPSNQPGVVNDLIKIEDGFLTKEELNSTYGRIGLILHARNPYDKALDYQEHESKIPEIMSKINTLLNCHTIRLLDDHDFFYLIHMSEIKDDRVHSYKFQRVQ